MSRLLNDEGGEPKPITVLLPPAVLEAVEDTRRIYRRDHGLTISLSAALVRAISIGLAADPLGLGRDTDEPRN